MNFVVDVVEKDLWGPFPHGEPYVGYQLSCDVFPSESETLEQLKSRLVGEILDWSGQRSAELPQEAFEWKAVKTTGRGPEGIVACVASPEDNRWALRMRVPERREPRLWNTDICLVERGDRIRFALRLVYYLLEEDASHPGLSRPTFIRDLIREFELVSDDFKLDGTVFGLQEKGDIEECYELVSNEHRQLAVVVFAEHPDPRSPYPISPELFENLGFFLSGVAYVMTLPVEAREHWSSVFGDHWRIDEGGITTFNPGWHPKARHDEHPSMRGQRAKELFKDEKSLSKFLLRRALESLSKFDPDWQDCEFISDV